MLRNLIILVVCAAASASIPTLFQANRDSIFSYMSGQDEPPALPVAAPQKSSSEGALSGRKVKLAADQRGHFVAEFRLNGRRVDAMVDTGATFVAINVSTARRIGLKLGPNDFQYMVETANGQTRAASASIESLEIGRIEVKDVQALVLDDQALSGTLIGTSFLNRLGRYQVENGALLMVQ
jgi:aspartyl protease family protein